MRPLLIAFWLVAAVLIVCASAVRAQFQPPPLGAWVGWTQQSRAGFGGAGGGASQCTSNNMTLDASQSCNLLNLRIGT